MNICHFCKTEYDHKLINLTDGRECCGCHPILMKVLKPGKRAFRAPTAEEMPAIRARMEQIRKEIRRLRDGEDQC